MAYHYQQVYSLESPKQCGGGRAKALGGQNGSAMVSLVKRVVDMYVGYLWAIRKGGGGGGDLVNVPPGFVWTEWKSCWVGCCANAPLCLGFVLGLVPRGDLAMRKQMA